jgi:toxin ParE1/3/4
VKKLALSFRDAAVSDILEQAEWYEEQADLALSARWERAVASVLIRLAQRPHCGTLCRFTSDSLRGIRRIPVKGFSKHLIFYRVEKNDVMILRVIHGARDLESLL